MKGIIKTKRLYLLYLCAFFLPFFSYSQTDVNTSLQGVIQTKSGALATVQGFLQGDITFPLPNVSITGVNFAFKGVCNTEGRFELDETTTFFFPGEVNPESLVSVASYILDTDRCKDAAVLLGFIRTPDNFGSFISIGRIKYPKEILTGVYRLRIINRNPIYPIHLEGSHMEVEKLNCHSECNCN